MVQAVEDFYSFKKCSMQENRLTFGTVVKNISKITALLLQSGAILLAASVYIGVITRDALVPVAFPLCLLTMSYVWSTGCQHRAMMANDDQNTEVDTIVQGLACGWGTFIISIW